MQMSLDLGRDGGPLTAVRDRLRAVFSAVEPEPARLDPVSQLVKSLISSRTKDAVSWAAFMRLAARFADWDAAIAAGPSEIEPIIAEVTHAAAKARQLPVALWQIKRDHGALELDFLATHSVDEAMGWLGRLTGIGPKSAACVLNFSRLNKRALVVDTHVHRVAQRLGLVGWASDVGKAYASLMDAAPDAWTPHDFFELHVLMKQLGQQACTHAEPRCHVCPLAQSCPKVGVEGAAVLAFRRP
jgi:endonuclease-3